ncbi:MAG: OmpA family protein [Planctomycetota bacterium]|nr:OmpA family protein [Planctomycetaceae bacterium]MDQ3330509.1 OmpA family protein [Planctomycetota bacterium]
MDDDAPPGVPEWVVTYGDMMSLLLTFFIMLVSMSEVKANERYRAVVESLSKYLGYPSAASSPAGENFPMNSLIEKLQTLGSHLDDGDGRGGVRRQSLTGEDMRVFRNREGNAIPAGMVTFGENSAELTDTARANLERISALIAGKPNKIDVRGFALENRGLDLSDAISPADEIDAPANAAARSLAYRRARAVLLAMEESGIRHDRLRITAQTVRHSGEPVESPERVDIFALDQFSGELVGPRGD